MLPSTKMLYLPPIIKVEWYGLLACTNYKAYGLNSALLTTKSSIKYTSSNVYFIEKLKHSLINKALLAGKYDL